MRIYSPAGARLAPYDRVPTQNVLAHNNAAIGPHALTSRATTAMAGNNFLLVAAVTSWIHRVTAAGTLGRARIQVSTGIGELYSLMHVNNVVDSTVELDQAPQFVAALGGASLTISTEDLSTTGTVDYRSSVNWIGFST
jgi:hypothetical protein